MRRTKIVCTLGPAVDGPERLASLVEAGMDVARFNFSHGTHDAHAARLKILRDIVARQGKSVAILQDLCGPKLRIGDVAPETVLENGARFTLTTEPAPGDAQRVHLPLPELVAALRPGDRLLLDDGLLELRVEATTATDIVTTVVQGGPLASRKGVTAPDVPLPIAALTPKDEADLAFGLAHDIDFVALSFVRNADDILRLRHCMDVAGKRVPILAKIEKAEAVAHLDEILDAADGAMVARGDLGVEMPIEEIPGVQKRVIRACNARGKPVITATQMLDSMIRNPRPTRAEVTDIANAILDGTDALMLSGETAIGAFPLESVRTMARVAVCTESGYDYVRALEERHRMHGTESVTDAVADAVATIAADQQAAAILCGTTHGGTARSVAKFRPRAPILAATTREDTFRRMALYWGVVPLRIALPESVDSLFVETVAVATASGHVKDDDLVVITAGTPLGVPGTTNLIKVQRIGQPL